MLIEVARNSYIEKDSIIGIFKSVVPSEDILNRGKPCVVIRYQVGGESADYRCFSSDIGDINQHLEYLISLFETVKLPNNNPFSNST